MSAIADCTRVPVEGAPHNIACTYRDEVNAALLPRGQLVRSPQLFPPARTYPVFARIGVTESGRCSAMEAGVFEVNINFWRSS
jgi:hypothetical protein